MCARLGAATGRGLLDLIRERFGIGWALFAVVIILIANAGVTVSEFVGIGAAMELMGISKYIAIPAGAVLIWYLVIFGSYAKVEKILLLMTLVFFAYPVAAVMADPDWSEVARGAFVPKFRAGLGLPFPDRWIIGHDDHSLHSNFSAELTRGEGRGATSLWPGAHRCLCRRNLLKPDVDLHDHCDRGDALRRWKTRHRFGSRRGARTRTGSGQRGDVCFSESDCWARRC